jgi:WD40 repeat protein
MQPLIRYCLCAVVLAVSGVLVAQPPQPIAVLKGHTDPIYTVAVSPDARIAATGSFDKTIKLWDLATRKEVYVLAGKNGHQNQVLAVAFSPSGTTLASGGSDNVVKLWDLRLLKLSRLWQAVFEPAVKGVPHPNLVDAVAFDKTGTLLATGCHDGILRICDVAKGTITKTINAHTTPQPNPIYTVAWSPDAKQVATGSFDKSIKVWDAASGNLVRQIRPGTERIPPAPVLAKTAPGLIGALGSSFLNAPNEPGHRDQVFTLAYTKDGKFLASASSDRTIKLWEAGTGNLVREFPNSTLKAPGFGQPQPSHPGFIHMVRFTPDESKLVSVGTAPRGQGYLAVWKVADGSLLSGQELPLGPIYAFDLLKDGVLLGCGPKARFQSEAEAVLVPMPVK